jgi:hypothetical protein
MEQQSIDKVKKRLIEVLSSMDLPLEDRIELMINLLHFLNDYEDNIEVLQKHKVLKLGE